jgi:hypothetical protein
MLVGAVSVVAIAATLTVARHRGVAHVRPLGTITVAPTATIAAPPATATVTTPAPRAPSLPAVTVPPVTAEPVALSIPAIGVAATIVPVGLVPGTSSVAVPPIEEIGWLDLGALPGDSGSSVLVGHVDGDGRTGVFWRLRSLLPGDRLTIRYADGSTRAFDVIGRAEIAKSALPAELFSRQGSPRLALITCGGAFDYRTGHYVDNVVVGAVPAGSSPVAVGPA